MSEDDHRRFLRWRGVRDACKRCKGAGVYLYGSGATWRGGMGTASMTMGTCDACWGTGDEYRRGTDLRKMSEDREHQTEAAALAWIEHSSGCSLSGHSPAWDEIIRVLESQERRRKLPAGVDPFWYGMIVAPVVSVFKRLRAAKLREEGGT